MSDIGKNIKKIRKEKGYSQKQLAEKLGTSPQNLAQYENDKRYPKKETIKKIAHALGVPEIEITGWESVIESLNHDLDLSYSEMGENSEITNNQIMNSLIRKEYLRASLSDIQRAFRELEQFESTTPDYAAKEELVLQKLDTWQKKLSKLTGASQPTNRNLCFSKTLQNIYEQLNEFGQRKTIDYAKDLSKIPEYRKEPEPDSPDTPE